MALFEPFATPTFLLPQKTRIPSSRRYSTESNSALIPILLAPFVSHPTVSSRTDQSSNTAISYLQCFLSDSKNVSSIGLLLYVRTQTQLFWFSMMYIRIELMAIIDDILGENFTAAGGIP